MKKNISLFSQIKEQSTLFLYENDEFKTQSYKIKNYKFFCFISSLCLFLCIWLGFQIWLQTKNKSIISIDTENHLPQQQSSFCRIGYILNPKNEYNQFQKLKVYQASYKDFVKEPFQKQWSYCIFINSINNQQYPQISYNSQKCKQKCCSKIQSSCYFDTKEFYESNTIQKPNKQRKLQTQQNKANLQNQSSDYKKAYDQNNNQSNLNGVKAQSSTTVDPGVQVIIIVFAIIFGIPLITIFIITIWGIITKCQNSTQSNMNANNFAISHQQFIAPQVIDLSKYKIDQIGPYHSNPEQKCAICLEDKINLRTYCGHYYHPLCIKVWLVKSAKDFHCPVCMNSKLNPMKVYCSRCFASLKLVIFNENQEQNTIKQIGLQKCQNCKLQKEPLFIIGEEMNKKQQVEPNPQKQASFQRSKNSVSSQKSKRSIRSFRCKKQHSKNKQQNPNIMSKSANQQQQPRKQQVRNVGQLQQETKNERQQRQQNMEIQMLEQISE